MTNSFDMGRVISRGFQTIGHQFVIFAVLGLLFGGLPSAVLGYLMPATQSPEEIAAAISNPWFWGTIFLLIPFSFLLQAAVVRASILDLLSEPVELGSVLGQALLLLLPMIGLSIVTVLGVALGMLFFIVPGIILFIMWIVAVPVLVEERRGVFGSMARSAELTKGARWWILLLLVIYLVASMLVGGLTGIVASTSGTMTGPIAIVLNIIVSTITSMVAAAMLASLYVELRLNKEGGSEDRLAAIFA